MIGEVSIGGVYVPSLLLLGLAALVATGMVGRVLAALGVYKCVAYRPAVDGAVFVILLGAFVLLTMPGTTNQ